MFRDLIGCHRFTTGAENFGNGFHAFGQGFWPRQFCFFCFGGFFGLCGAGFEIERTRRVFRAAGVLIFRAEPSDFPFGFFAGALGVESNDSFQNFCVG